MNKGWLELESDPGLFTLLLQDFGVKGVQVEEIYDLQKLIDGPVYGFIFLFRWIEERRSRRKTITEEESFNMDEKIVNSIFFAQQIIPNSCATHALLSVLLNCEKVNLGETLSKFKEFSKHMNPEIKGYAIGNMPELAKAHNSHARPEPFHLPEKQQGISTVRTMEAFHFVSYVPIGGHLFELDGLKPYPIDHGPWESTEDWTEKFRRVITERLGMATGGEPYHDIRYNLMAVVPDRRQLYEHKLATLKTNRQIVLEALQQMVKVTNPELTSTDITTIKQQDDVTKATVSKETVTKAAMTMVSKSDTGSSQQTEMVTESPLKEECSDDKQTLTVKEEKPQTASQDVEMSDSVPQQNSEPQNRSPNGGTSLTEKNVKIQISVPDDNGCASVMIPKTMSITDVTKPLTIETKFGGSSGPSSSSTDTASEVGSCFSSPSSSVFGTSCQNSPDLSSDGGQGPSTSKSDSKEPEAGTSSGHTKSKTKFSSHQGFRPKDLLALLKNVKDEIARCEGSLKDDVEKFNKYKIDDCRRTHNYDQFICTFLSMLAEQGHLAELVQQHMLNKKHQSGVTGRVTKAALDKRRRPRPKRRR